MHIATWSLRVSSCSGAELPGKFISNKSPLNRGTAVIPLLCLSHEKATHSTPYYLYVSVHIREHLSLHENDIKLLRRQRSKKRQKEMKPEVWLAQMHPQCKYIQQAFLRLKKTNKN